MTDCLPVPAPDIVPSLKYRAWADLNLDAAARAETAAGPTTFLNPQLMQAFVENATQACGDDYSFGGYGEDRSFLWSAVPYLRGLPLDPLALAVGVRHRRT